MSIFPENFPVNIANPEDLAALRALFPGREGAIVVELISSRWVGRWSSTTRPVMAL